MEHPSPARSTRELSFAEIFDPLAFTRSRRRYRAIRDSAVYVLHEVEGAPDVLVALGRDYKPLGAGIPANLRVDFAAFPRHHFARTDLQTMPLASPGHAEGRSFWFWQDSTAPYAAPAALARYRLLLLDVFGREGLARLAALAGRELGDYPDRTACEASVRRYGAAAADACFGAAECAPVPCRAPQSVRSRPDGSAEVRCGKQDSEQAICATAVGSAQARLSTPRADGEPALAPLETGSAAVSEVRTQIRIWVPSTLAARLYRRAAETQRSVRHVVLDALGEHLGNEVPPAAAPPPRTTHDDGEGVGP